MNDHPDAHPDVGSEGRCAADRRGPGRPRDEGLAERRREEILRAAMNHFAAVGYASADLDSVASAIGCAKGTLYRYFPSKRELFLAAADEVMRGLLDRTGACESPDPLERHTHAIREFLRYFDEHPEYVELLIQERAAFRDRQIPTYFQYRQTHCDRWLGILAGLMREGRMREMPPERAFTVVGDLLYGTIFTNYFCGRKKSLEEQAEDLLDVIYNGLLTPAERARRAGGSCSPPPCSIPEAGPGSPPAAPPKRPSEMLHGFE